MCNQRVIIVIIVFVIAYIVADIFTSNYGYFYHKLVHPTLKHYIKDPLLKEQFFDIFPTFDVIVHSNETRMTRMNADRNSLFEYATFSVSDVGKLDTIAAIGNNQADVMRILEAAIKNVSRGGKQINIEDCVVVDIILTRGGSFPAIHTDVEWRHFINDGFQVWFLLENDVQHAGNMFLFDARHPAMTQGQNNLLLKKKRMSEFTYTVNRKETAYIPFANVSAHYVGLQPGEGIVLGQNVLHMSDIRTSNRIALTMRVVLRNESGRIDMSFLPFAEYSIPQFIRRLRYGTRPHLFDFSGFF